MHKLSLFDTSTQQMPTIALEELFEAYHSCRKNKRNTANFGIKRVDTFIRKCSQTYTKDYSYVLKLDIQGFFMHINKNKYFMAKISTVYHSKIS